MLDNDQAAIEAAHLNAVAEPTRLRVLLRLMDGPQQVKELCSYLDLAVVNVSHHLSVLKTVGLVHSQRDGRYQIYELNPKLFKPSKDREMAGSFKLGRCFIQFRRPECM